MTVDSAGNLQSLADRLVSHFYAWERRGRGWQVYPQPVRPEPAFEPFRGHFLPETTPVDDGRRSTILSSISESLVSLFRGTTHSPPEWVPPTPADESLPVEFPAIATVALRVELPAEASPKIEDFEEFLVSAVSCHFPVGMEILGANGKVSLQLLAEEGEAARLSTLLASFFPDAVVTLREESLNEMLGWEGEDERYVMVVDFGLSNECMLPLATYRTKSLDPYIALGAALSDLEGGEAGVFQVLFEPVAHPWAGSIVRAVTMRDGSPFFDDAPEFLKCTREKIAKPLFAAVVRIGCLANSEERALDIARSLSGSLFSLGRIGGNEFIPLSNDEYDNEEHVRDLLERRSRRSGAILNSEELATLVHFPTEDVRISAWERLKERTKAAPASALGHAYVLGENVHHGKEVTVTLSDAERVRHMHVVGASGSGKSTLLLNLIIQDMEAGQGIAVVDPHGDLIDQVMSRVPEKRIKDVVLLDPSDSEYPIGFNILSAHSDLETTLLASDLVAVFRRFSTSWGDQMGSVLSNAVLAFLESSRGGTLADLRRFLIEPPYRNDFLTTVQDDHVSYYWSKEFPLLSGRPQAPLLTRLDTFLRPKPIRHMVSQKENRLDFAHFMDSGKIFLAKLAHGLIGEENAALLGALLVSKFHQLTLGRQSQSESSRRPFYLYADEFGSYVTPSMGKLLTAARKYRLGLILAHQELQQLHDPDVESALLSNAGTRICFRVGDKDAKTLAEGFSTFKAEDLRNLPVGHALCRLGRADDECNLITKPMPEVAEETAKQRREAIIKWSREKYATKRSDVEAAAAAARDRGPGSPAPVPVAYLKLNDT